MAVVAVFLPRRWARRGWAASSGERFAPLGGLAQGPPQPLRALFGDVAVPDGEVAAADGGGQARPGGELAGGGEAGDVADLGCGDPVGERTDAGQLGEGLDPRIAARVREQLPVESVDGVFEGVGEGREVVEDAA